jgi:glutathione S-transferase
MLHLVIANKLYSSWSLRPWMLMTALGIPFQETVIPMYQADTKSRMLNFGPTGKCPVLVDGDVTVWESLAIVEYLAEQFPDKAVWPTEAKARAHARAISSEMHAGFQSLRQACPMNLTKRFKTPALTDGMKSDVARLEAMWKGARERFGGGGPFLFGAFCAADAMYAPVVTRFDTYQIPVSPETRAYMGAVLGHPAFVSWRTSALKEPWTISHYEDGLTPVEEFKRA